MENGTVVNCIIVPDVSLSHRQQDSYSLFQRRHSSMSDATSAVHPV
jgi:hypothetical protein